MGEWSDYFEDFPEENPANERRDEAGERLRARVAREAKYSPEVLAQMAESRTRREEAEVRLLGMRLKDRECAQIELHRSIGGLMEAYAWFDVKLGSKIKSLANHAPEVLKLLRPSMPMKLRLDCLRTLVDSASQPVNDQLCHRWDAWISQAEAMRLLRNDYAHGRWVHDPKVNGFRFASLSWNDESEIDHQSVPVIPAQVDELSRQIWELTRSIDIVTEPFFSLSGTVCDEASKSEISRKVSLSHTFFSVD